jgi:hypothetical protein
MRNSFYARRLGRLYFLPLIAALLLNSFALAQEAAIDTDSQLTPSNVNAAIDNEDSQSTEESIPGPQVDLEIETGDLDQDESIPFPVDI